MPGHEDSSRLPQFRASNAEKEQARPEVVSPTPDREASPSLPRIRASDADREQARAVLKEACLDGRLTLDELAQRLEQVEGARTRDTLQEATRDLLAVQSRAMSSPALTVAVMSEVQRVGRWRVGEKTTAIAVMGACKLDLRQAVVTAPVTTIKAVVVMGALDVFVPEGVEVELETTTIMGARTLKVAGPAPLAGGRTIRITGLALMGAVNVHCGR